MKRLQYDISFIYKHYLSVWLVEPEAVTDWDQKMAMAFATDGPSFKESGLLVPHLIPLVIWSPVSFSFSAILT